MSLFRLPLTGSRVKIRFAPVWLFGYQYTRHCLPIGNGGAMIQIFVIPFLAIVITI